MLVLKKFAKSPTSICVCSRCKLKSLSPLLAQHGKKLKIYFHKIILLQTIIKICGGTRYLEKGALIWLAYSTWTDGDQLCGAHNL